MNSSSYDPLKVGVDENTPRQCKVCGKILPLSMFSVNGNGYYERDCKKCKALRGKKLYQSGKASGSEKYWGVRLRTMRKNAELRGLSFALTIEDIKTHQDRQKNRCWYTGKPMKCPSVDRIDNDRGYSPDNIIMCENSINIFRGNRDRFEFIDLCKLIAVHHTK
jgi:phage FluMu protein Com